MGSSGKSEQQFVRAIFQNIDVIGGGKSNNDVSLSLASEAERDGLVSIITGELASRANVTVLVGNIASGVEARELVGGHEVVEGGDNSTDGVDGFDVGDVDVLGGQIEVSGEGLGVRLELRNSLDLDTGEGDGPNVGVVGGDGQSGSTGLDEVFFETTNVELSNSFVDVDGENVAVDQLASTVQSRDDVVAVSGQTETTVELLEDLVFLGLSAGVNIVGNVDVDADLGFIVGVFDFDGLSVLQLDTTVEENLATEDGEGAGLGGTLSTLGSAVESAGGDGDLIEGGSSGKKIIDIGFKIDDNFLISILSLINEISGGVQNFINELIDLVGVSLVNSLSI